MPSDAPHVLFRDDTTGAVRLFAAPREIIVADQEEEFFACLDKMEAARAGGAYLAGYMSYEAGYLFEPKLMSLARGPRDGPLLCFGVFDAPAQDIGRDMSASADDPDAFLSDPSPAWTFAQYEERFERLHRHLRAGDCYQANLTMPVTARWRGRPLDAFRALIARQPVKYGALVDLGGPVILSRSPELFFGVDAQGFIETHPMKGTVKRGASPREDREIVAALLADGKTLAENRMIVDLLRNDIARIAEDGTLDVPKLFAIETYPTVHQMVSHVRAKLLPGLTLRELFAALFPCGSVTGAPKMRAMEILAGLEEGPRNAYCGAIGMIAPDGTMRFSVAIRTITLFDDGRAVFNVGGGIVFDSTAQAEYAECLLKTKFAIGDRLTGQG